MTGFVAASEVRSKNMREYGFGMLSHSYWHKGNIWMASKEFSGLFRLDLQQGKLTFAGALNEGASQKCSYESIVGVDDRLYLMPRYADSMVALDLFEYKWEKVGLGEKETWLSGKRIAASICRSGKIYIFSENSPEILKFDAAQNEMEARITCADGKWKNMQEWYTGYYFAAEPVIADNKIIIPYYETDAVCIIDLCSDAMSVLEFHLKHDKGGFAKIREQDGEVYLLDRQGSLYYFDLKAQRIHLMLWEENIKDFFPYQGQIIFYCEDKKIKKRGIHSGGGTELFLEESFQAILSKAGEIDFFPLDEAYGIRGCSRNQISLIRIGSDIACLEIDGEDCMKEAVQRMLKCGYILEETSDGLRLGDFINWCK